MSVLDMFSLTDKVVVVTGASSGLGVSFAIAFAEAGADVVLAARRT
ncbi:SDR family NAD(P)-dependent oxidoreductase, partial [Gordonia sp. i37]